MNSNPLANNLAKTIFISRWLQAPLYIGLILVQLVYVYEFGGSLKDLIFHFNNYSETHIMLAVLDLIDVVMIANLLIMVIIGGYETFVSRLSLNEHPDQPEWLDSINAGTMKVKVALALIGISSIHLLKTFIDVADMPFASVMWQVVIHVTFLVSALMIALTNRIMDAPGKKH